VWCVVVVCVSGVPVSGVYMVCGVCVSGLC
jgi:hypothetical protein